jgi:hypothetical protein
MKISAMDERWDNLIVLALDGELNDEQRIEFDRLVEADAAFALRLQEFKRIDESCHDELVASLGDIGFPQDGFAPSAPILAARRSWRAWLAYPLAAAACLAVWLAWPQRIANESTAGTGGEQKWTGNDSEGISLTKDGPLQPGARRLGPGEYGDGALLQAGHSPTAIDRLIDNDLLYVVGDDGNIYVIDQQSIQTSRRHNPQGNVRLAAQHY